jgi:hypothetical protein
VIRNEEWHIQNCKYKVYVDELSIVSTSYDIEVANYIVPIFQIVQVLYIKSPVIVDNITMWISRSKQPCASSLLHGLSIVHACKQFREQNLYIETHHVIRPTKDLNNLRSVQQLATSMWTRRYISHKNYFISAVLDRVILHPQHSVWTAKLLHYYLCFFCIFHSSQYSRSWPTCSSVFWIRCIPDPNWPTSMKLGSNNVKCFAKQAH